MLTSATTNKGIEDLWSTLCNFKDVINKNNEISRIRQKQLKQWFWVHLKEDLINKLMQIDELKSDIKNLEIQVQNENLTPGQASDLIIKMFIKRV